MRKKKILIILIKKWIFFLKFKTKIKKNKTFFNKTKRKQFFSIFLKMCLIKIMH